MTPQKTQRDRRKLIFAVVSIALFLASLDQTIVATGLPEIERDLRTEVNWGGWTISGYALGQIIAMPLAGKISDMYGRKKVFMISTALFTLASLCCGLAPNIALLLLARFVQALGGGAFTPSATGIVSDHFGEQRDRALGLFTSVFPIGGIVGPVAGGLFVTYWSWRGIFLVNLPIGLLLVLLTARFIPASAPRGASRIDVAGILLLTLLLMTGMFGITYLGSGNVPLDSPVLLGCSACAVVTGFMFVWHSRLGKHSWLGSAPFVPYQLLRGRGFGIMNLINYFYGAATLGFAALVPLYATFRYGISALGSGTLLSVRAVMMIVVGGVAAMMLRRTGYRWPMVLGLGMVAAGLAMMAVAAPFSPCAWLSLGAALSGLGMGLAVPAANNASLQLAPDQVAAITGLRGMFRQTGAVTAVSVATALIARSPSAGAGITQANVFLIFAGALLLMLPLIAFVPEHRGNW
jgi:EmrB/QacA subfamily drug resistance transporter